MKKEVPEGFCFVVKKGRVQFVKYIQKFNVKEESEETERQELIEEILSIDY